MLVKWEKHGDAKGGAKEQARWEGWERKKNACCWPQTDDDKQNAYFNNKQEVGKE